jgi:hypothetical protein
MLWKYKRAYQETNEDVIDPTICVKLISAEFISEVLPPEGVDSVNISFINCEDIKEIEDILNSEQISIYNECIQLETLEINGELTNITIQQVSNAIANNNGAIGVAVFNEDITEVLGNIIFVFGNCEI